MRGIIKSILLEEYGKEPQIGDFLLCHSLPYGSDSKYLTKDKVYRVINRKFFTPSHEVIVIKDGTNTERMFTVKPLNGLSYKNWFHLLDDIDTDNLFRPLDESEEEDEFEWVDDIVLNTGDINDLSHDEFIKFINQYFKSHPSPKEGRIYTIQLEPDDRGYYELSDHTGAYFHLSEGEVSMEGILDRITEFIERDRPLTSPLTYEILEEFEDLLATLKPLIKGNIKESEEDEFGWAEKLIDEPVPLIWSTLPKTNNSVLFYFYPKISKEEFMEYVAPILSINDILFKKNSRDFVDHLEIHHPSTRGGAFENPEKKLISLQGDINYGHVSSKDEFIRYLSVDNRKPINGREYFGIR